MYNVYFSIETIQHGNSKYIVMFKTESILSGYHNVHLSSPMLRLITS